MGISKKKSLLENLNFMIFGFVAFLITVVVLIISILVMKQIISIKNRKKLEKFKKKVQKMISNGIHESINNGSIPLLTTTFFDITKKYSQNDSFGNYCGPIVILSLMVIYPISTYLFIRKKV